MKSEIGIRHPEFQGLESGVGGGEFKIQNSKFEIRENVGRRPS